MVAVNAGIFPFPLEGNPTVELLLLQANTVPATVEPKETGLVPDPLHLTWPDKEFTVGVGFTKIVNGKTGPGQVLAIGVTEIVAVTAAVLPLRAWKDAMFPEPEAPSPI